MIVDEFVVMGVGEPELPVWTCWRMCLIETE